MPHSLARAIQAIFPACVKESPSCENTAAEHETRQLALVSEAHRSYIGAALCVWASIAALQASVPFNSTFSLAFAVAGATTLLSAFLAARKVSTLKQGRVIGYFEFVRAGFRTWLCI